MHLKKPKNNNNLNDIFAPKVPDYMKQTTFLNWVNSRWRMGFFLFWKLPAAWFMGIRVVHCDAERARIALPYSWRAQNPFSSTYFAAQCAAGELSTGLLAMAALQDQSPVSMLVTAQRSEYYKKADKTLVFECIQGVEIAACIQQALETGDPQQITALSIGRLPNGTEASRIWITWSFKRKTLR